MPFYSKQQYPKYGKSAAMAQKPGRSRNRRMPPSTKVTAATKQHRATVKPEVKTATFKTDGVSFNGSITSAGDLLQLFPEVYQGSADSERVGRRIRPVSLIVRGYVSWDASFTAAFGPVEATVFAIRTKRVDSATQLGSSETSFLDEGGLGTQYDGSISRSLLPVLTENYELLGKVDAKISGQGSSGQVDQAQILYKKFEMKLPVRHDWHYAGSGGYPDNWCGFITAGFVNPRVIVQGDLTYTPLKLSYTTTLKYTD